MDIIPAYGVGVEGSSPSGSIGLRELGSGQTFLAGSIPAVSLTGV